MRRISASHGPLDKYFKDSELVPVEFGLYATRVRYLRSPIFVKYSTEFVLFMFTLFSFLKFVCEVMLYGVVTARVLCVTATIPTLCICGDAYMQRCVSTWSRALCDSTVHAAVASVAWLVVTADQLTLFTLLQSGVCGLLSSAVDLDHFIAASSLSLQASWQCYQNKKIQILVSYRS